MTEDTEPRDLNNIRNTENASEMFILEPDIGLGDHIKANRISRNHENARREESSISFRRFLQNDGPSSRSSHPDLYTCARQDRSTEGGAIDPESPDLPDFVQDHLAVEQMYFNDGAPLSNANLPDFASFMSRPDNEYSHSVDVERRRNRNQVPLDLPVSNFACNNSSNDHSRVGSRLPFDLTTDSSENNIASNGSRLPDFLSDGHIFGSDNSSPSNIPSTSHNPVSVPREVEERTSVSMLERDNERLRDELQALRSALMKKDDRIKELENIVMALEISKVQMSTDANTQTVNKSNDNERLTVSKQKSVSPKKSEIVKSKALAKISRDNINEKDDKLMNPTLGHKVKEMTNVSERLVRELLKIITDFQDDIDQEDSPARSKESKKSSVHLESIDNNCSPSSSKNSLHPK